jgi:hypothetical protein
MSFVRVADDLLGALPSTPVSRVFMSEVPTDRRVHAVSLPSSCRQSPVSRLSAERLRGRRRQGSWLANRVRREGLNAIGKRGY